MAKPSKVEGANGSIRWKGRVRLKGHPQVIRHFDRYQDCQDWINETQARIRRGRQVPTARDEKSLDELFELYRSEKLPELRSASHAGQQVGHLEWWSKRLGSTTVQRLSRADVRSGLAALKREPSTDGRRRGPATQNRYLATLRSALSMALDLEWIKVNPASRMQVREPRGVVRFLSKDEKRKLLEGVAAVGGDLELLVRLALATGARQNELLSVRWQDIDMQRRLIVFEETKNTCRRSLPLDASSMALLAERRRLRHLRTDLLFVGPVTGGKRSFPRADWNKLRTELDMDDFRFHDLRHTFASWLAMEGASLNELAAALGHRTLSMVQRYAHLTDTYTHTVVRRMTDAHLSE